MASERETEINIRRSLSEVGIQGSLLDKAVQAILGTSVPSKPQPKKRRCGASLPHERGEDGWRWCGLNAGHTEPHMDVEDHLYAWEDRTVVEVTVVEEIWAVSDHIHQYTGDEDACQGDGGCQLTYGEYRRQQREWRMDHD